MRLHRAASNWPVGGARTQQLPCPGPFTSTPTPRHIDKDQSLVGGGSRARADAFLDVFVELTLLSRAACLLTSHSGFSLTALWMSDNPGLAACHRVRREDEEGPGGGAGLACGGRGEKLLVCSLLGARGWRRCGNTQGCQAGHAVMCRVKPAIWSQTGRTYHCVVDAVTVTVMLYLQRLAGLEDVCAHHLVAAAAAAAAMTRGGCHVAPTRAASGWCRTRECGVVQDAGAGYRSAGPRRSVCMRSRGTEPPGCAVAG